MDCLFTKPLQVNIFKSFRYLIMVYMSITNFIGSICYPMKEHTGNSEKHEVIRDTVLTAEGKR